MFDIEHVLGHAEASRAVLRRLQEAAGDPETPGSVRDGVAVRVPHRGVSIAFHERDLEQARALDARIRALPPERFVGVDRQPILDTNAWMIAALEGRVEEALALLRKPAPSCGRSLNEAELYEVVGDGAGARRAFEEALGHPVNGLCTTIAQIGAAEGALAAGDTERAAALAREARETWRSADPDLPWARRLAAVEAALAKP